MHAQSTMRRLAFKSKWTQRLHSLFRPREIARPASDAARTRTPGAEAAWDEAFLRVESYLCAHHVEGRVRLNQFTTEIIAQARLLARAHPEESPVTLAVQIAQARVGEWLMRALGEGDWTDARFRARGRLALLMSDIPRRHAGLFLGNEPLPAELRERLAQAQLFSGPELQVTGMPPAPLDFPLVAAVEERWETFSRSTFLRAASSWLLFIGLLGGAWIAFR